MNNYKILDQYYINPKICDLIIRKIFSFFPNVKNSCFLEPSAGSGNFVNSLIKMNISKKNIIALDIEPFENPSILKFDYLNYKPNVLMDKLVIIGNPPFGKRGKLALSFLNKALNEAKIVAFILPNIFSRYNIQSKINKNAKLIFEESLPSNSFLVNNKEYNVNCIFQIWINNSFEVMVNDLRLTKPKSNKHKDFDTFIHNNTNETLKYFDKNKYKWDIAIYRQGYYDYNTIFTDSKQLISNRQYLFIKFNNKLAREICLNLIDYENLSQKNTTTPGFSLTDFVEEYEKQKTYLYLSHIKNKII